MDGYIRVSQVGGRSGDRFQSPSQQRDSIEAWAKTNGVTIAAWHEDLDRSGGTMDRPGMNEALRRVQAGVTGGLVVARLDRFARTVVGGLTTIHELHERGARVVSVAEKIDPGDPMGRAFLGLLLIMAEWQRDQADASLELAMHRATSAGRFPGKPSFGYARTADGLTVVDEPAAERVRRIFRERARGTGWRKIADDLTRDRIPTPLGRDRWAASTVNGLIRSEAPLGVFVGPRGLRVEGAWPAIVDRPLWEAANDVRGFRPDSRLYQDRLVAGLARCAGCRYVMVRAVNHHGFVSYGCPTRGCPAKTSMGAELLDAHVTEKVNERLGRRALAPRPADDGGEGERLTAARDAAAREFEAWRDDTEMREAIGEHDYRAGMIARARARDDTDTALAEHRARAGLDRIDELPAGVAPDLASLPWEVRQRVVGALVHSVWVRRSELRGPSARQHVDRRLRVVWRDDHEQPSFPSRTRPQLGSLGW